MVPKMWKYPQLKKPWFRTNRALFRWTGEVGLGIRWGSDCKCRSGWHRSIPDPGSPTIEWQNPPLIDSQGHRRVFLWHKKSFCSTDWRSCYRLEGILGLVTSSLTGPNAPATTRSMTRAISNAWHAMQAGRAKKNDISTMPQFIFRLRNSWLPSGKLTELWKITIFNGNIHYTWWFSIAMLNYQRVKNTKMVVSPRYHGWWLEMGRCSMNQMKRLVGWCLYFSQRFWFVGIPSGKLLHFAMERSTIL